MLGQYRTLRSTRVGRYRLRSRSYRTEWDYLGTEWDCLGTEWDCLGTEWGAALATLGGTSGRAIRAVSTGQRVGG
eukprot:297841-Rhodomonas_salina.5